MSLVRLLCNPNAPDNISLTLVVFLVCIMLMALLGTTSIYVYVPEMDYMKMNPVWGDAV